MFAARPNLFAIICLALVVSVASPGWAAQKRSARKTAQKPDPVPEQTTPPPPPTPQTLAQMPAVPPQVSFQNGQLTIIAHNSTLGDILHAVHRQTGASFDMPPNATERVVTQLGPGPAREVLASLLNGSHFDYVMVGSPNNPSALDHVILMQRNETAAANQPAPQPSPQAAPTPEENAEAQPDDFTDDNNSDDLQVDQAQQQQAEDQQQADQQQQQPIIPGQPGVKTPEQLLQELQQRQQQQQQQGGAPTPAPPQGFPIPPGQQPNPNQPQPPQ